MTTKTIKDYYSLLEITPNATQDEIRQAYRRLARTFHPDISTEPNAAERFKELNEANTILADPAKRKVYDSLTFTSEPVAPPPDCDWYLHGHTHRLRHEPGRPAVVNPGEASGWLFGRSTVALLDTESGEVEFLDLKSTC